MRADRQRALALLVLCATLRVPSFARTCLSDDEATYAVVAREMLAGRALYRDVVDHKPPAIYGLYAVTQAFGPSTGMVLLHVLAVLVVWATGLLLIAIARRRDETCAWIAGLLYVVFTTTLADVDALAANCELFMMLPLVASAFVVVSGRRARDAALAGVLVGIAALFKYQALVQLPLYAIVLVRRPNAAQTLPALAVGAALPFLAMVAVFRAAGSLDDAAFWFRFNFSYIKSGSAPLEVLSRAVVRGGFVVAAGALLYACATVSLVRKPRAFELGWIAVSAIAVSTGGRFFGHYFYQLIAPLAVAAVPAATRLWDRHRAVFVGATTLPALAFVVAGLAHDRVMRFYGEPDPDFTAVVAWLDAHAARDESVWIWGNLPVLAFEAERPLGARFVFANYLTGASPATPTQTDPEVDSSANIVPEAWDMLDRDLATRRPRFIVDASPGNVGFYGKYPAAHFPRLERRLTRDYRVAAELEGMRIFERSEP